MSKFIGCLELPNKFDSDGDICVDVEVSYSEDDLYFHLNREEVKELIKHLQNVLEED